MKQEQGAAPGWFQALLCTCRISIKHRKEKSHHSLISFQMYHSCVLQTNESFLNALLTHLHQQLICRKCSSTTVLVSVLNSGHTLLLFPSSLLSWDNFGALSLWDMTPHKHQSLSLRLLPRDQGSQVGAVMPVQPVRQAVPAKVTCMTSAVLVTILAGVPNPEHLSTCGCLPLGRLQGVLATSCVHHLSCLLCRRINQQ